MIGWDDFQTASPCPAGDRIHSSSCLTLAPPHRMLSRFRPLAPFMPSTTGVSRIGSHGLQSTDGNQLQWMERGGREDGNLKAALAWFRTTAAAGDADRVEDGLATCGSLMLFWHIRAQYIRMREAVDDFLVHRGDIGPTVGWAMAMNARGMASMSVGDLPSAIEEGSKAVEADEWLELGAERCRELGWRGSKESRSPSAGCRRQLGGEPRTPASASRGRWSSCPRTRNSKAGGSRSVAWLCRGWWRAARRRPFGCPRRPARRSSPLATDPRWRASSTRPHGAFLLAALWRRRDRSSSSRCGSTTRVGDPVQLDAFVDETVRTRRAATPEEGVFPVRGGVYLIPFLPQALGQEAHHLGVVFHDQDLHAASSAWSPIRVDRLDPRPRGGSAPHGPAQASCPISAHSSRR